jgi:uncharacterized protein (UPF0128 family)
MNYLKSLPINIEKCHIIQHEGQAVCWIIEQENKVTIVTENSNMTLAKTKKKKIFNYVNTLLNVKKC